MRSLLLDMTALECLHQKCEAIGSLLFMDSRMCMYADRLSMQPFGFFMTTICALAQSLCYFSTFLYSDLQIIDLITFEEVDCILIST